MTDDSPIRIAVVGSGPAGFYAAGHLLKEQSVAIEVDMLERLPTPWGLVRSGVAPALCGSRRCGGDTRSSRFSGARSASARRPSCSA